MAETDLTREQAFERTVASIKLTDGNAINNIEVQIGNRADEGFFDLNLEYVPTHKTQLYFTQFLKYTVKPYLADGLRGAKVQGVTISWNIESLTNFNLNVGM